MELMELIVVGGLESEGGGRGRSRGGGRGRNQGGGE